MLIDGALSQRISLMESASEFCYRYRKTQSSTKGENGRMENKSMANNMPSVALSSTKTRYINKQPNNENTTAFDEDTLMEITTLTHPPGLILQEDAKDNDDNAKSTKAPMQSTSLPVLASSCPGFVCLVEKTAPAVVPLLSSAKSPMAVAGTLLKTTGRCSNEISHASEGGDTTELLMPNGTSDGASTCYHVAIMPCHDKKLEAGRGDFSWERQALLRYGNRLPLDSYSSIREKGIVKPSNTSILSVEGANNGNENDAVEEDLVSEVDLVLTTGELLEVLGEAAAKWKGGGEADSAFTTQLPSETTTTTKEEDGSTTSTIRDFLAKNDFPHGACHCELMTGTNNSMLDANQRTERESALELETGVHGSGSYADFIFRHAAQTLFGCELPSDEALPWKSSSSAYASAAGAASTAGKKTTTGTGGMIRRRRRRQETTDLREVALYEHDDGTYSCQDRKSNNKGDTIMDGNNSSRPVLRFATAYGFKNVQLILQSLSKTSSSNYNDASSSNSNNNGCCYDYVEIMACPSGCSNGGGQIGANGRRETPRETKERVRKTVSALPILRPAATTAMIDCSGSLATTSLCDYDARSARGLVNESLLHGECFGESSRQLLHTRFHVVPKLELSTGATAGVAVSDTRW